MLLRGDNLGYMSKELSSISIDQWSKTLRLQRKRDPMSCHLEDVYNKWICYMVDFRSFEHHTVASLKPFFSHILGGQT